MTVVAGDVIVILHDFEDGETRNYGRVQTEVLLTRIDILLPDDSTHDDR